MNNQGGVELAARFHRPRDQPDQLALQMNLRPRLRSVQATGCNLLPINLLKLWETAVEVIANRVIGIAPGNDECSISGSLRIDFQLVPFSQLQLNGLQEIAVDLFAVVLNALSQFVEPQRQNNVDCLRQLVCAGSAELPVFDWTEKVVKRFCAVKNDWLRLPSLTGDGGVDGVGIRLRCFDPILNTKPTMLWRLPPIQTLHWAEQMTALRELTG